MCGLLGVAGDITYREIDAFKELLYISTLRGWDSTGAAIFTRKSDGEPFQAYIAKMVGPSHNLLDSKAFDKAMGQTNKKILLGHTRAATRGNIRTSNSHPFEFAEIVGAHNGTLDYNTHRDLPFHNYFDTDSEALISSINDKGVEETISGQEGAWALSLVNKNNGTLQFIRNKERDLCYCLKEDKTALFWASEAQFLRFVLYRKDIKIFENKVMRFTEDTLYTYDVPLKCGKFDDPERKVIKGKERAPFQSWRGNGNSSQQHIAAARRVFQDNNHPAPFKANKPREESNVVKMLTKHSKKSDDDSNLPISLLPQFHTEFYEYKGKRKKGAYYFKAMNGRFWDRRMFENITKCGCSFCGKAPDWGNNVLFCRSDAFLCQACAGDEGIEEAIACGDPELPIKTATELNDPLPTIN